MPPEPATRSALLASFGVFFGSGLAFASWATRIPQVRADLDLTPASLGLLLLCLSIGSLLALPTAGWVVHHLGSARTFTLTFGLFCLSAIVAGFGTRVGVGLVAPALVLAGYGFASSDVAMNVEGAEVERRLGRSLMPRLHAAFSIGTVTGALLGAGFNALGTPVWLSFLIVFSVIGAGAVSATRYFLAAGTEDVPHEEQSHPMRAWLEPRTLLIGLFVLTMAFAEGTATDWLGIASIDGFGASEAMASVAFGVFLAGMTITRWFGVTLLDRRGRVPVLRWSAVVTAVGVLLVVLSPSLWLAIVGMALWGLGTGLGFPVGMSAASDDPARAAGRVGVVASIGYMAFLLGPPLVGLLGERSGVLRALAVTAAMMVVALLTAGATRPLIVRERNADA